LRTFGPQRTFAKKWWALKVLNDNLYHDNFAVTWPQPIEKSTNKLGLDAALKSVDKIQLF
jgi:hypothetical protein